MGDDLTFSGFLVLAAQGVLGRCENVLGFLEGSSGPCVSLVSKPSLLVLTDGANDLFIEVLDDVEVVKDRLDMGQRSSKAS